MKSLSLLVILLIGLLSLAARTIFKEMQIQKAEWLLGTWENKTDRGSVFEAWTKMNEKEFFGQSYILQEKDTVLLEEVQLIEDQENLFYIPTVKNQNDGMPIQFGLTSMTDTSMVFEHPSHDFPQMISYVRINRDSLVASISGINNGQELRIVFPMTRVP